ncbi:MAG TPA: diguanylate cyclase, partial [Cellvibrionaceae bacterium]|nr:diguanylate cyclase [Cellvibrionaceae bacterium]
TALILLPDGDGWGWEKDQSCVVTANTRTDFTPSPQDKGAPQCQYASNDPNQDGWGWENKALCQVGPSTLQKPQAAPATPPSSIDASAYDGFLVSAIYEGRADYISLHLRDADTVTTEAKGTEKFMSALVKTADLRNGPVFVGFNAFSVDEWWVFEQNPPRHQVGAEFKHLVQVGINHTSYGIHRLQLQEIKLVGQRISDETYLMSIMLVWIAYLVAEAGFRYRYLTTSMQGNTEHLLTLERDTSRLEYEKLQLKSRSRTDPLTGVSNRNGLNLHMQELYAGDRLPSGTAVAVLDIDHFKTLNDTHGHDAGDQVLVNFARVVTSAIRARDVFVRWGGEEFVLLFDDTTPEKLHFTCEKLRQLVADSRLVSGSDQQVTVSIGAALTRQIEGFETVFKRADAALYRAKRQRNTVEYEA